MRDFIHALTLTVAIAAALLMADYLAYGKNMVEVYKAKYEH